jgi:hypothetical protein
MGAIDGSPWGELTVVKHSFKMGTILGISDLILVFSLLICLRYFRGDVFLHIFKVISIMELGNFFFLGRAAFVDI